MTMKSCGVRYNFDADFKRQVCEYYSNHTFPVTKAHFNLPCGKGIVSKWYLALGFLPKSSGPNPSPKRMKVQPTVSKSKANMIVKSGGFIMDGVFYGKTEFAKVQKTLKLGDKFKTVTVSEHVVGIMNA